VEELESEILALRDQLEGQCWRMAELVRENTARKTELGANGVSQPGQRRGSRSRAAIVSKEEMEFALSMGRSAAVPPRS
jgi:hypothetical protein